MQIIPPIDFVAGAMELPMMDAAERYSVFVADLEPQCPGLSKAQMVRIGRRAAAYSMRAASPPRVDRLLSEQFRRL